MLDRETKNTYNLVVTAKDCAKEPEKRLSSTVQVRRTEKIYILCHKIYVYFINRKYEVNYNVIIMTMIIKIQDNKIIIWYNYNK